MKKVICAFGCVIALMLAGCQAQLDPSNSETDLSQAIQVETDAAGMLPLRYTAESSGYTMQQDEDGSIVLQKGDHEIQLQIDNDTITLDGEIINLKYTPVLIGDETYLPVEFYNSMFTEKYITQVDNSTYTLSDKTPISAENMMNTVREISQYPRHPNDETHKTAMQYVIDKFAAYGYEVEKQEFEYDMTDFNTGERKTIQGTNLIAVKKADLDSTGDVLVLGAHYDGFEGMPAANDNGSGLSVLLELARVLHDLPSDTEVRFVAFDAEEDGL